MGGASQLEVSGEYRPPGGAVGRISDQAVLHRIAQATVEDFVRGIASVLPTLTRKETPEDEDAEPAD